MAHPLRDLAVRRAGCPRISAEGPESCDEEQGPDPRSTSPGFGRRVSRCQPLHLLQDPAAAVTLSCQRAPGTAGDRRASTDTESRCPWTYRCRRRRRSLLNGNGLETGSNWTRVRDAPAVQEEDGLRIQSGL